MSSGASKSTERTAPQPGAAPRRTDDGFSLVEVLFALILLMVAALGSAQLFAVAVARNANARHQTSTTVLAAQKMEQLRALTWGFDPLMPGFPASDTTSNLAENPVTNNGQGLNPSPTDTIDQNTPGYVDYLDKRGQWVGTGAVPPPTAQYIRRWNVRPLPTNPNNTLILQVLVTTMHRESQQTGAGQRRRMADDALLTTVKTRKSN